MKLQRIGRIQMRIVDGVLELYSRGISAFTTRTLMLFLNRTTKTVTKFKTVSPTCTRLANGGVVIRQRLLYGGRTNLLTLNLIWLRANAGPDLHYRTYQRIRDYRFISKAKKSKDPFRTEPEGRLIVVLDSGGRFSREELVRMVPIGHNRLDRALDEWLLPAKLVEEHEGYVQRLLAPWNLYAAGMAVVLPGLTQQYVDDWVKTYGGTGA